MASQLDEMGLPYEQDPAIINGRLNELWAVMQRMQREGKAVVVVVDEDGGVR